MLNMPVGAQGAVFAALIAGALTFLGLIVAKEHRVSEFRQNWIDSLRADIAEIIARISVIVSSQNDWDEAQMRANAALMDAHFLAANQSMMRTRLRLNPNESDSQKVLAILDEAQEIFNNENRRFEELDRLEKPLLIVTQRILKKEWKRVQRGEAIFVASKWAALLFVLIGFGRVLLIN